MLAVLMTVCASPPTPAPAPSTAAQPAPTYDADLGLASFDSAWSIIYRTHFDTTFNGVDWPAVRDELRPRAKAATTTAALRSVINDMLEKLGESHFALIPKEIADTLNPTTDSTETEEDSVGTGDLGLDVRLIGGDIVVTGVEPGSPADSAGVRTGWIVATIGHDSVAGLVRQLRNRDLRYSVTFLAWSAVEARFGGAVGSAVTITFLDGDNQPRALTMHRREEPSVPVRFGNFPTFFARFASDEHTTPDGHRVGRIWFNFWMVPLLAKVDQAVDAFRGDDGIIIDLRGNRGGMGGMVMGVAGHFLKDRTSLGDFRTRTATLHFRANPRLVNREGERVTPFQGPLALLVDETSVSASEVFAGGMQSIGRARVFGTTSLGAALPAVAERLPDGDVLYHAIADFVTADGVVLEGRGVVPDEAVRPTRADLLAGRDPVLDAALRWIDTETGTHDHP
jgi:carboxyl-terminal processing protease